MAAVTIDGTIAKVKMVEEMVPVYGRYGKFDYIDRQAVTIVDEEGRRFWGKLSANAPKVAAGDVIQIRCSVSAEKDTITFVNRIKILALVDEEDAK